MSITKEAYIEQLNELNITGLAQLTKGVGKNCCAVVKWAKPVKRSGGVDYVLAMVITDPTVGWFFTISVNLFEPKEEAFATVKTGDIIVFNALQIHEYNGKRQGRNVKRTTTWAIIDKDTLEPRENDIIKYDITDDERQVVNLLSKWYKETAPPEPEVSLLKNASVVHGTSSHRIAITTDQIETYNKYFDYLGEVVSYSRDGNIRSVMFVTDYTKNPRPPRGDYVEGTIEPNRLLSVTLWNEHSEKCPSLEKGDFIYLENLRSKTSSHGSLEAVLRGESSSSSWKRCKVKKIHPDDIYVKAIIDRRKKYFDTLKTKGKPFSGAVEEVKPNKFISLVKFKRKHISISNVLDDNDIALLYKVRAKIVDYKPQNVKDWVRKWCPTCDNSYPVKAEQCRECKTPINRYIFQGVFLVEDGNLDKLMLYVYGEDSQNLFANFAPAEPTQEYINNLKKKLKIICSEDQKVELGVKSYVVPKRGRRYGITNTQITFC